MVTKQEYIWTIYRRPKGSEWIWDVKVPVGAVWKLLPWNRGLPPTCAVEQVYLDDDVRIAKDTSGQYFVYARPV